MSHLIPDTFNNNLHRNCLFAVCLLFLFTGCANFTKSEFDNPVINLKSFKMLPQNGISPRFEIGLNVVNPNREPLELEGIFYTVAIEGHDVIAGVANQLPRVEGYSEADITLEAGVDILSGVSLISSLMREPKESFKYSFKAKLDTGLFSSKITIKEEGVFDLNARY